MKKIKLFLVDDHQVVIDGISSMISGSDEVEIVGQAMNGPEALAFLQTNKTDVAIIDINLPGMDGVELCKAIRSAHPEIKTLALTTFNEASFITRIMKCGASGYLLKNTSSEELLDAIKKADAGEQYLSKEVQATLVASSFGQKGKDFIPKLTRREKEVLQLIMDEMTTKEIAEKLFISVATVETHRLHLLSKLEVRNTAGLVKIAIQKGLVN